MVTTHPRIGIIGAGTTGVYLTSLLAEKGYHVDLFEKSEHPRTDGCGILLISSGMNALAQGNPRLCHRLISLGAPVKTFEFRNLKGKVGNRETVEYEEGELPGMLIHRKAILETLLQELPPECLHLNAKFSQLSQTEKEVTVQFEDGRVWQGDLLIGCDGIYSKVRNYVVPDVKLCYLGDIVWRGIVQEDEFCSDGLFVVYFRGRGIYANFFDIGHGYTHWGFFIEKEQEKDEYQRPSPYDIGIPPQELAKLPDAPRKVIESTPLDQMVCNFSYDIDPIPQLYHGRVLLMGDAAHAKSPTRARGMTSGFEDAVRFVYHLENALSIETALAEFQAERLPIVHKYQQTSREMSQKIGRSRTTSKTVQE